MDMKLTDKVDVFHLSQIPHQQLVVQDVQTIFIQTEREDVTQQQLFKISYAQLVS